MYKHIRLVSCNQLKQADSPAGDRSKSLGQSHSTKQAYHTETEII